MLPILDEFRWRCFSFAIGGMLGLACWLNSMPPVQENDGPPDGLLNEDDTQPGQGKPAQDATRKRARSESISDAEVDEYPENTLNFPMPIPGFLAPASPAPRQHGLYTLAAYSSHAPVARAPPALPIRVEGISGSTLLRRQAMGKVAPYPTPYPPEGRGWKRAAPSRKQRADVAAPPKMQPVVAFPAGSHRAAGETAARRWRRTEAPLTRSRAMCKGSNVPTTFP